MMADGLLDEWDEHFLAMELRQADIERVYATYWPVGHQCHLGWLAKANARNAAVARAVAVAAA